MAYKTTLNNDLTIKHPAMRYHGGKWRLAKWVISHMPEHRKYVEPFGGAAGVLLQKEPSYCEVYNDLDSEVVNFFRVLRDPALSQKLIEACVLTPYARAEFELAYESTDDPVELDRRMVVRASMGFGSAGATKNTTGFRIDTERKYSTAMHLWSRYPENIAALGQRFSAVLIENRPAISVLQSHDADDCLHFVDPPYLPEVRARAKEKLYFHEMSREDHQELIEVLHSLKGMVMVCGYESELYERAFKSWTKVSTTARISAFRGTKTKTECMWLSPGTTNASNLSLLLQGVAA